MIPSQTKIEILHGCRSNTVTTIWLNGLKLKEWGTHMTSPCYALSLLGNLISRSPGQSHEMPMTISWDAHDNLMRCPWQSHEMLMTISWDAHDNLMRCPWQSHEMPMTISWDAHDNLMKCPWQSHEMPMTISWCPCSWQSHEMPMTMRSPWQSHEMPMTISWDAHDNLMRCPWQSDNLMRCPWQSHEMPMTISWDAPFISSKSSIGMTIDIIIATISKQSILRVVLSCNLRKHVIYQVLISKSLFRKIRD